MRRTSLAALVVLLGTAGCGGEENGFTDDYNRAVRPLNELSGDVATNASRPKAEIAEEFESIAASTEATRDRLSALDPPEGARDEMRQLLGALDEVVHSLRDMADATLDGAAQRQQELSQELAAASERVGEAEGALQRAVRD